MDDIKKIIFAQASLVKLPYRDKQFDKIYCISVLEHLRDVFNKRGYTGLKKIFQKILLQEIFQALQKIKCTLKDEGLIVLTFDYLRVNLDYLREIVERLELEFAGEVNMGLPDKALYSEKHQLYCYLAVLKKKI